MDLDRIQDECQRIILIAEELKHTPSSTVGEEHLASKLQNLVAVVWQQVHPLDSHTEDAPHGE